MTRVAVILPCFDDGGSLERALGSISEPEPVERVVVDDCSSDPHTLAVLDRLRREGVPVVRHETNRGVGTARMTGLAATSAPYVFPLDADDLAEPGSLSRMADALDAHPDAAVCYGPYAEFGASDLIRAVPRRLDPFRIAYRNEYPVSSLFRRTWLERVGGWRAGGYTGRSYEDWNLWMALAEAGAPAIYGGDDLVTYRRTYGERKLATGRRRHRDLYRRLRTAHPDLFDHLSDHRRTSDLGRVSRLAYPFLFGGRRRLRIERLAKQGLDRLGVETLRR